MPRQKRIKKVTALAPYKVRVRWSDNTCHTVDLHDTITSFRVFKPLVDDPDRFKDVATIDWGFAIGWEGDDGDMSLSMDTILCKATKGKECPICQYERERK